MTISQPDITINIIPAALQIGNAPHRVLAIGQKTSAGSATALALTTDIQNDNSENDLFGPSSQLAAMVRAYKKINKVTRIDAIALDDNAGGTAATGSIAFTGPATENGTLYVTIGSYTNHRFELGITSGDTATTIAAALEALVNADTKCPVTGVDTTGTLALTCVHKGTYGNNVGIRIEGSVAGVAYTITAMTSGATNPSLTTLFDAIEDQRYQTVIWPGEYTLSTIATEMDARFNTTNKILDGVAITALADTYANLVSAVSALNSKSLVVLGNNKSSAADFKGSTCLEIPDVIAAEFAAVRALRLTDDANIAQYIVSTIGGRDSFGGTAIASLPYFNTPFYNLPIIPAGKAFTREEVEDLADAGVSVLSNNVTATQIIAGEIVTTYHTDVASNPDPSFKYLEYVDTIVNAREYMWNNLRRRFAQCRLTEGDLLPNRSMANQQAIESYLDQLYTDLSGAEYVLVQAGETALQYFRQNRDVTLDMVEGKVNVTMVVPIVVQLRTILATLQLSFSTEG